jgi:DNA-binding IclR family transcriptional regulator
MTNRAKHGEIGAKRRQKSAYFVPALEKGLDILEALSLVAVPQTLADLSRLCGRSRSEIFRMVDALEKREYIVRDPVSGGYELTLKLYQLAHTHSPVDRLLKAAYFPMRDLANTVQESCHLCVLSDDQLLVIAESESPSPVRLSVAVGYRTVPLMTASGRLLLAMLEDPRLDAALEREKNFRSMNAKKRRALRAELARIGKTGVCLASSAYRTGVDVSCLVGSTEIGVTAALGVPFISGGVNHGKEKTLIAVIQKYARRITQALGLLSRPMERSIRKGENRN